MRLFFSGFRDVYFSWSLWKPPMGERNRPIFGEIMKPSVFVVSCQSLPEDTGARLVCLFVLENPDIFQRLSLPAAAFFPSLSCFSSCATPRSSSAFLFIMQTCTQPPSPLFFIHHVHEPRNPSTVDDALSICSCRAGALARSHALTHTRSHSLTHSV